MSSIYSTEEYTKAQLDLLPPGRGFDKEKQPLPNDCLNTGATPTYNSSTDVFLLLEALATEWQNFDGRTQDLLDESLPNTATETLDEWEREVGLEPDPELTEDERRRRIGTAFFTGISGTEEIVEEIARLYGVFVSFSARADFSVFTLGTGTINSRLYPLSFNNERLATVTGAITEDDKILFEEAVKKAVIVKLILHYTYI